MEHIPLSITSTPNALDKVSEIDDERIVIEHFKNYESMIGYQTQFIGYRA